MRIKILQTNWQQDQKNLSYVRFRVFVEEQGVPEALEIDQFDQDAEHFIAMDVDRNLPVGTARLLNNGHVGRMAVLADYRCKKIGHLLINRICNRARELSMSELFLHAQTSASGFYQKAGFHQVGDVFDDAGIDHIKMIRKL